MTDPAGLWLSLFTRHSRAAELPPRETPPLLDELRAVEDLLRGDGTSGAHRPRAAPGPTERRLYALALRAAREHHQQQRERHAFALRRAKRKERQDAFACWLALAVLTALAALVIVAAGVHVVDLISVR